MKTVTVNNHDSEKTIEYRKQSYNLTINGNNNTILFEDCPFCLQLTGIGNRIIISNEDKKIKNCKNEIKITGSDNIVTIVNISEGEIDIWMSGNGNEI